MNLEHAASGSFEDYERHLLSVVRTASDEQIEFFTSETKDVKKYLTTMLKLLQTSTRVEVIYQNNTYDFRFDITVELF